jgi:carboxyl-terminal processing protease
MIEPAIGYIRIKGFQDRTDRYLEEALKQLTSKGKLSGLVLDLRNNPGGLLEQAVRVADLFLDKGRIVSTVGQGGRIRDVEFAHAKGTYRGFPMACLVNEGSASASEIVAGALQDHKRAVIMGTPTFGKGSVQQIIELGDGSALKLTVARYYTPSGRSIQEHGINPDILVQAQAPKVEKPLRKKKTEPRRPSREMDLKGHLANRQEREKPLPTKTRLKDFQLQTALDYLRAAQIFGTHSR